MRLLRLSTEWAVFGPQQEEGHSQSCLRESMQNLSLIIFSVLCYHAFY